MSTLVLYAIPAFIVLMLLEGFAYGGYESKDTRTSLSMGLGNVFIAVFTKAVAIAIYAWLYQHRLVSIGTGVLAWVVLLFAEDFCYYWFHRSHHEVRLLWAAHENHHSSQRYNLSTALRQSWTTPITGPLFWAPLALVGFTPWMILTAQAWSLLYQFWIHTESIRTLGPLEWFMNTPSHHRVHHGANIEYLDRNHGGIFIIWDRLFGTFEPERAPVVYGLTTNIRTFNPVRVAFHEYASIARDVKAAPTLRAKLGYVFAPPGWSHDGSKQTADQMRATAASSSSR